MLPCPPRLAILAVALLLLTACQGNIYVSTERPNVTKDDPDTAVIVVGAGLATNDTNLSLFERRCPAASMSWTALRRDSPKTNVVGFTANEFGCLSKDIIRYSALRVPAGDYVMNQSWHMMTTHVQVKYITNWRESELQFSKMTRPKIRLSKGDVVYLGDFIFSPSFPMKLAGFQRSDEKALDALSEAFPQIDRSFVFRPAFQMRRGADPLSGTPATSSDTEAEKL